AVKPMTKSQIVDHLANKTSVTKKTANLFLDELETLAHKEAKKTFTLHGIGKLVVVDRNKRMGRNPATGETNVISAKIDLNCIIIDNHYNKTSETKKTANLFQDELETLAQKEAKKSFTLPGIGKLVVVDRKKRMGRNPATVETIVIPAKKVLKFRIAKAAKD